MRARIKCKMDHQLRNWEFSEPLVDKHLLGQTQIKRQINQILKPEDDEDQKIPPVPFQTETLSYNLHLKLMNQLPRS